MNVCMYVCVGVSPNNQSILMGLVLYHDIDININCEYIIIRHLFVDFVLFQNNKVPRIVSPFNGTLSIT
jgi:hypothetical protein